MISTNIQRKLTLQIYLENYMVQCCNLSLKDEGLMDNTSMELLDPTDYAYVDISPIDDIDGVMIFGDGTIEFHEENCEAFNWSEYDVYVIEQVVSALKHQLV